MREAIPFVLSIDVEPDGFQLTREQARSTTGYDALVELIGRLRPALEQASDNAPSFGWFFRMDPQIEVAFGRADHLMSGFGNRVAGLIAAGDHVGLHTHPLRWSADTGTWVHDVSDPAWTAEVIASSFAAFERCFDEPCVRHRMGGALYTQEIVDALEQAGTRVESAFEPVRGRGVVGSEVVTGVDTSPMVGCTADCAGAPRDPYRPAAGDFRRRDAGRDGMVLLPLTTSRRRPARTALRAVAVNALRYRRRPPPRMLYLGGTFAPTQYWDLVARRLRTMRRPYVNVAIRTDAPGSSYFARACAVLEALPGHPLASRIAVVDPIAALPRLLGEPGAVGDG